MPRKTRVVNDVNDSQNESDQDEYKDEDMSDDEDLRRRRRNRNKGGHQKPKIIDDTWLPSSNRKQRACIYCKLVLNQEKWNKLKQCPNCPESLAGPDETTDCFESVISLILPMKSWVAEWQQMKHLIPGVYALALRVPKKD
jgi:RNA polymerase subunit RPABC4/transcription elongation factor Spt4